MTCQIGNWYDSIVTEKLKGIYGSMFSGKTETLFKEITNNKIAGKKVVVFKPAIDDRWGLEGEIRSHSGATHPAFILQNSADLLQHLEPDTEVVFIDEVQFFDEQIIDVVKFLLDQDIQVVFDGLSSDFRGEPFGSMPILLSLCDEVERLKAICTHVEKSKKCGQPATKTQRLINGQPANYNDPIIVIGDKENYEARCPKHHLVPGKPKPKI